MNFLENTLKLQSSDTVRSLVKSKNKHTRKKEKLLNQPSLYTNREMSWLEFNQRVLDQAMDERHPLLERVKFLSITGTNLDEFFMVRVATILRQIKNGSEGLTSDGLTPKEQFTEIHWRTEQMLKDQHSVWTLLRPLLEKSGVKFLEIRSYTNAIKEYLHERFMNEVYPVLTPMAFDPGHPFPHISSLSMNLAVVVRHNQETKFARVKIPDVLPRFLKIPESVSGQKKNIFVFLEDVIRSNIDELFPGTEIRDIRLFRIIRDTDLVIQEDEADDLLETVDKGLKQIRYGDVSLLQVEKSMPKRTLSVLAENCQVDEELVSRSEGRMNFADLMQLMKLALPQLKDKPFFPPVLFDGLPAEQLFERIRHRDYLLHHPYQSFYPVEALIKAAAEDPQVLAVKMTLYRVGSNSPVIEHLINAAEAGKQVTVLVELKARFDERNNIVWARRLEAVGAHVIYGVVHLKTHSKICLIVRQETDGIRSYMHLGTGNYNPFTSKIYTDLGLLTSNHEIGEDATHVFNYLTGYSNKREFNHLLVAPVSLRSGLDQLIDREMQHAREGRPSGMIFKVNSVADSKIINKLYEASDVGVHQDLIVRGICCLKPGVEGVSEKIRVRSVIGRFLEHSRIYYFENGGIPEIYCGSADLMERNLSRRVEILFPIIDLGIREHLKKILDLILSDNIFAYNLKQDGSYERIEKSAQDSAINSQQKFQEWYAEENPTGELWSGSSELEQLSSKVH
ncbi:MAG: polyphosphate kinase 1 [SAR324 cluster bacterium]|nr:polyphosphate kinase 1 [SAR324 cluster bacterium]